MELCPLEFEIYEVKEDKTPPVLYRLGEAQYSPDSKSLVAMPRDNKEKIIIPLKELSISKDAQVEGQVTFEYKEDNKAFKITLSNSKKETLGEKTLKYILSIIYKNEEKLKKKERKIEKSATYKDIISKPTKYQEEMFQKAKEKNTIVFLETGLGKTYISILLLKHYFNEPLEANAGNILAYQKDREKKALFIFGTNALLLQQAKVIRHNTNLKILKLYGKSENLKFSSHKYFEKIFKKTDVVCGTPECIYRYFTFGYFNKSNFKLLVLDECHHCKGDNFYNKLIMHFFFNEGIDDSVRVLGLTASPIDEKVKEETKIHDKIVELCNNMGCTLACPSNIISGNIQKKSFQFLTIDYDNEREIKMLKRFLFHKVLVPILEFHFEKIFKKNIVNYKGRMEENSEEKKTKEELNKETKLENEIFISMTILSHCLTLFADESQLEEKYLGIYTEKDIKILRESLDILEEEKKVLVIENEEREEEDKKKDPHHFLKVEIVKKVIEKMEKEKAEKEERGDFGEKINFTFEFREFKKKFFEKDDLIKLTMKYCKISNLIFKYLDTSSLVNYTNEIFKMIEEIFYTNYSKTEEIPLSSFFEPRKNLEKKKFCSSYLKVLVNFVKTNKKSKSVLFVNHRVLAREINRNLNEKLKDSEIKSTYVVGVTQKTNFSFTETEMKKNISLFRNDEQCKIIVATNVIEEGIDVPDCDNVICLSDIVTIKEYIQKSGRARKEEAKIYFFATEEKEGDKSQSKEGRKEKEENLNQIVKTIDVMKELIKQGEIAPTFPVRKYIKNHNYFETPLGAKCYLSYSKKIVDEFISKLENDGYTFMRARSEAEEKNGKWTPYLTLPSKLESSFQKIYDPSNKVFNSKKEANSYFERYANYYYLQALIKLYENKYLNEYLQFEKCYDNLISEETKSLETESEKRIAIKSVSKPEIETEEVELVANVMEMTPGYIDINYSRKSDKYLNRKPAVLSSTTLPLVNFDLFIPSTVILRLYHYNINFCRFSEEWFKKKPVPYSYYTKLGIEFKEVIIKVPKAKMNLINFFYVYSLFFATDAELFFYYSIYTKKFDFSQDLFLSSEKVKESLEKVFEKYDIEYLKIKHHLKAFCESILNYQDHLTKFSILLYDEEKKEYKVDFDYITKIYNQVKKEIISYANFFQYNLINEKEKEILVKDEELLEEREKELEKFYEDELEANDESPLDMGDFCRNFMNFSKTLIMSFSLKHIQGETKNFNYRYRDRSFNNQQYYIYVYGILTRKGRQYKKCIELNYNLKIMRYKINLKALGDVRKKFSNYLATKKYHFFPMEVLQRINHITLDQSYLFTFFPIILFKIQNNLIYYYYSNCLMSEYSLSFKNLQKFDMKLFIQSLNGRSTLEHENYERLEFLGDSILKFLSSTMLFVNFPEANKDLLFSRRREIENNDKLFEIGKEKEIYKYLFTSPITVKRVMIPGFSKDESLIFDISYNRSFAKHCYKHKIKVLTEENKEIKEDERESLKKLFEKTFEEDEMLNEKKTDKTNFEIEMEENPKDYGDKYCPITVTQEEVKKIVEERLEVIEPKTTRIIYKKNLADIIESINGFVFETAKFNEYRLKDTFEFCSMFLKEINVLSNTYKETLEKLTEVGISQLNNENCVYSEEQKKKYMNFHLNQNGYTFKHPELLYQALTHSTILEERYVKERINYVTKSYQRLCFLGETIIGLFVSRFVYERNRYETEKTLHKMRICGINHQILARICVELKLHDRLQYREGHMKEDIKNYEEEFNKIPKGDYKVPLFSTISDNDHIVMILCEIFQSYIGAIFVDSGSIETVFEVLEKIMNKYLSKNATLEEYTEHPKETILNEYQKRRQYFKRIKENGGNRVIMKKPNGVEYKSLKLYQYQLVIDDYIIYEEKISYNRNNIMHAQEKAKLVFLKVCKEIDYRESLKLHESNFNIKNILDSLKIDYKVLS